MDYKTRAENAVGQGTLTNSKHWNTHVKGVYPTHIKASTGPYLIDVNGKKYLDFICGLGTNLFGYGHPLIENQVERYFRQGKSPSLPHILEVEVAEQMKQCFPWTRRWKFLKSGSEACTAAVRMARAFTGRQVVLSEGYHGWHDAFISLTPPATGIPPHQYIKNLNRDNLTRWSDIAAIVVEPVILDDSKERLAFLSQLRELCDEKGILLIFDEVITGMRYLEFSVARKHNITPDLIVVGKSIANGYPLAAVGGDNAILDGEYFVSSTFAGEILSLGACKASLELCRSRPEFHTRSLWDAGKKFLDAFNESSESLGFKISGYPTRGMFVGDPVNTALFMQEACLAGILFGKSWFISHSHLPLLDRTIESCKDIMERMRVSTPSLKGEMPQSPFAARVRKGADD